MDGVALSAAYERHSLSLSANYQFQSQQLLLAQGAEGNGRSGDLVALGASRSVSLEMSLEIVVERAYARLRGKLGGEGVQFPAAASVPELGDFSPEAVSDRIVTFATSFLGAYLENHAEQPQDEAVSGFQQLIRDAIEEGFRQARDILASLSALSPQVGGIIDRTFELTMAKLDAFFANLRGWGGEGDVVELSGGGGMLSQLEYYEERVSVSFSLTYTEESRIVQSAGVGGGVDTAA